MTTFWQWNIQERLHKELGGEMFSPCTLNSLRKEMKSMVRECAVVYMGYPFDFDREGYKNSVVTSLEIDKEGNVYGHPSARGNVDKWLGKDWNTYFYERFNKSSFYVFTPFEKMEFVTCPNYYEDDEYINFLSKEKVKVKLVLVDTHIEKVVGLESKTISGRALSYFKKTWEINSSYMREELDFFEYVELPSMTMKNKINNSISAGKWYHEAIEELITI